MATLTQRASLDRYWRYALWLAFFTNFYNLVEGLVSIFFGFSDEALTLFGFGLDSFIEVLSGTGMLAMVTRIRQYPDSPVHSLSVGLYISQAHHSSCWPLVLPRPPSIIW